MRRRDTRSEEIIRGLVLWVANAQDQAATTGRAEWRFAERLASTMLFDAACAHYRDETDRMDSTAAVRWIRSRLDALIAECRVDLQNVGI